MIDFFVVLCYNMGVFRRGTMKYFKYRIWDGYRSREFLKLYNGFVSVCGSFKNMYVDMCFLAEIKDGKYYDLITGEEITYCIYPYSGKLAFESYEMVSNQYVANKLKLLEKDGIEEYKREIDRMKDLSIKVGNEYQDRESSKEINDDDKFIMEFVKKHR